MWLPNAWCKRHFRIINCDKDVSLRYDTNASSVVSVSYEQLREYFYSLRHRRRLWKTTVEQNFPFLPLLTTSRSLFLFSQSFFSFLPLPSSYPSPSRGPPLSPSATPSLLPSFLSPSVLKLQGPIPLNLQIEGLGSAISSSARVRVEPGRQL